MNFTPTARLLCCYILCTLFTTWSCSSLTAAPVIDQDALVEDFNFGIAPGVEEYIAQTFTAGAAGLLSQIDLQLLRYSEATTAPTVQIRSTTGGVPGATAASVLYETTVDISGLALAPGPAGFLQPVSFDVGAAGILVNPGDVLAISMQSVASEIYDWTLWTGRFDDPYPQGTRYGRRSPGANWTSISGEYSFRTWVDPSPPEPGDFNGDGDIDGRDFLAWQRNPSIGDLADWLANYGNTELQATSTSVPEPSASLLVMIGIVLVTRQRLMSRTR